MSLNDWMLVNSFQRTPEEILRNRTINRVYVANFASGEGKYISAIIESDDPVDAVIKISPRIDIRLTYIINQDKVIGIQISKLNSLGKLERMHLSTLDWEGVQRLLYTFGSVDMKSIATRSLILDNSIVGDQDQLKKFLITVASDPQGKIKFKEVGDNFNLIAIGDVGNVAERKAAFETFNRLLNEDGFIEIYMQENSIGKTEQVWQGFFQNNSWMLGSDVIRILEERGIDEESISDLPVESMDGFLDIIELKLPTVGVFTQEVIPTSELTKATMQCMRYITEYERRMNDAKKLEELGVSILKPRITLIFGRSSGWSELEKAQFRILNSSYHSITILTYDHILERARRLAGINNGENNDHSV